MADASTIAQRQAPVADAVGKYDKSLEMLLKQLSHIDLTDEVYDQDAYLDAHGGFCDVFIAKSKRHGDKTVAVKRLRIHILHHKDVAKVSQHARVYRKLLDRTRPDAIPRA